MFGIQSTVRCVRSVRSLAVSIIGKDDMVNEPTLQIEEYIPDAETEFNWSYYTPHGLSMKVRLNDSGCSKYYSKFAIEFENTGGYEMQTLPISWRRCEDGKTET